MEEGNRELSTIQFCMRKEYFSNFWIYIKTSQSKKTKIKLFKSWEAVVQC